MAVVAVVGIGVMGSRLATRLLRAGHTVLIWNRSPDKLSPLIELGARAVATPADAAVNAQILITMVSDPSALRAVTEGSDGIAAGANAPLTVIEMSTVGLSAVKRLASMLPRGTTLLDAPVLGSRAEAESGSLVVFLGGSAPFDERVMPVLNTFGSVIHVGGLGAGNAAKLVANASLFGTLGVLGEALALAQGLGLSDEVTYRVLAATPLAEQAERRRVVIEGGQYPAGFRLALARKDATLIRDAAAASGLDLRLAKAAETWLEDAETAGLGDLDYTAVLAMILFRGHRDQSRSRIETGDALFLSGSDPSRFDGFVLDLDGVIWRGDDPIDGAAEAVSAIRRKGVRVLFLTNETKRSRRDVALRLCEMGITATTDDVMTAAAALAQVVGSLNGLVSRRAFVLGPPELKAEIQQVGFQLLSHDEAASAEVVVVAGHHGFNYAELCAATLGIQNGARLFATGRDAVYPTSDRLLPGTGAILAAVETAGGVPAVIVGKPEPIIFEIALQALAGCTRVCVIGDHLTADIAGAKRAGLGAILVLSGVTKRAHLKQATVPPDLVLESLAALPALMRTPS